MARHRNISVCHVTSQLGSVSRLIVRLFKDSISGDGIECLAAERGGGRMTVAYFKVSQNLSGGRVAKGREQL